MDQRHRQALLAGATTSVIVAIMGLLFLRPEAEEPSAAPTPEPEVACGSWHAVPATGLTTGTSALHGLDGSPNEAWAVGSRATQPVVLRGQDGRWQLITTPALPEQRGTAELHGVVARAPDDVWTVGFSRTEQAQLPIVLHWDGQRWTAPRLPRTVPRETALFAVDANDDEVVAVGGTGDLAAGTGAPVILSFDDRRWTIERPQSETGVLRDVLVDQAGVVVAAGFRGDPVERVSIPFVESRNGRRFREFLAEERARNALFAVAEGPDEREDWTLGTMAALFDGRRFERQPVALAGTTILDAVQTTPRRADAVGVRQTQGGPVPVFARWSGDRWDPVRTAATSEVPGSLEALVLARNGNGWAVGTRETDEGGQALLLRKGC